MKIIKGLALAAMAMFGNAWAAQPATYHCTRLDNSYGALGIDDRGVVTGTVQVLGDGYHPAVWRRRTAAALPYVPGFEGDTTRVYASNRHGHMAGSVDARTGGTRPVLWTDGVPALLPRLVDAGDGTVRALNERGHAVGDSMNAEGLGHAVLWKNGKVVDLGALGDPDDAPQLMSAALDINASGMVVGVSASPVDGMLQAVQWTSGTRATLVDLGAHAYGVYSEARSVNRDGVVVGLSSIDDGWMTRPIGWINGVAFDLKGRAQSDESGANGINDAGTVVGYATEGNPRNAALVWPHYSDEPIDLNTRLDARGCRDDNGQPVRLTHAVAINNRGEILAKVATWEGTISYRLVPLN